MSKVAAESAVGLSSKALAPSPPASLQAAAVAVSRDRPPADAGEGHRFRSALRCALSSSSPFETRWLGTWICHHYLKESTALCRWLAGEAYATTAPQQRCDLFPFSRYEAIKAISARMQKRRRLHSCFDRRNRRHLQQSFLRRDEGARCSPSCSPYCSADRRGPSLRARCSLFLQA